MQKMKSKIIKPRTNIIEPKLTTDYLLKIRQNSYLGKKGYTIPLSILSLEDIEFLRKDLFVKPIIQGINYGQQEPDNAFPVFRESINKLYLPRFYGIQRYGMVSKNEISAGDNINVKFNKNIRDYQEKIINVYMNHINQPICDNADFNGGGGILEVPCGRGKCMGRNTPIMLYNGNIKMVQDIKVGDVIMGDDSTPRTILSLARGKEQMYKIIPSKGDPYIVNESHILSLKYKYDINTHSKTKGTICDISVIDFLYLPKSYHSKDGALVGYRVPILFPKIEVILEPYLLGFWLGNESSNDTAIQDAYIVKHLTEYCLQNKFIPYEYKCNDRNTQLELLAGIVDSIGLNSNNSYEFNLQNERLIDDIIFVSRSLGFAAYKTQIPKTSYYKTTIYGKGMEQIPVKYSQNKVPPQTKNVLTIQIKIEKLDVDDYYGFEIDGNRRFVLGDFTVTHNTVMALKIISLIQKKTLIIVHKEFLMNQWIERIAEFIPDARIGKIQGPVFDIVNKDIVIGMVQTLYDKDYGQNGFSSFGLTIIDEVHRIGSEQFSRTLIKTITPYMLGISATVDRKDQLTRVLYMFIGDKIYTEQREDDDLVQVRAIKYICNDPEFNEVEVDFRGNTKYSSMISKLCDYIPRSNFIVKIVADLLDENEDKQIMILCHNRSLLTYLYTTISERNIASIGYYIGGMKPADLQATETKQIVLATYAMAAEALDIKTLSTLIMATPKTDITQSVGRILRVKNNNPIIIDIIDNHSIFQNQWTQRKKFYKKCNYMIRQIQSPQYTNMCVNWNTNLLWKLIFDPNIKSSSQTKNMIKSDDGYEDDVCNGPAKCLIDTSLFDI